MVEVEIYSSKAHEEDTVKEEVETYNSKVEEVKEMVEEEICSSKVVEEMVKEEAETCSNMDDGSWEPFQLKRGPPQYLISFS